MEFAGVRLANNTDEDRIYDFLVKYLYAENALFDMSPERVRSSIRTALSPVSGVCGIIEGDGGIEASIGLIAAHPWYSDEWYLDEIWTYVHPDFRKSDRAKRLIEFAKWISTNIKTPLVMGIVTRKRLQAKVRLFQRQMPQVGAWFVYGKQFDDSYNQREIPQIGV